ncbi:MAG: hypothetical protein GY795_26060 [Desulfobacterales bacterium]|nr:hypothetical protein [Desulfobacterales bacterium]
MKYIFQKNIKILGCLTAFLIPFGMLGCCPVYNIPETIDDNDSQHLEKGLEAFQTGDYQGAAEIFETLNQQTDNSVTRRKAIYGLACSHLMLAQDTESFDRALLLLDTWIQMTPADLKGEDPRMLKTALSGSNKNIEYSKLLKTKEKEIRRLKYRLGKMKTEIRTLEHQIETLEAIHQEIQEKKKEISAP